MKKITIHERSSSGSIFTLLSVGIILATYHLYVVLYLQKQELTPAFNFFFVVLCCIIIMAFGYVSFYQLKALLRVRKMNSSKFVSKIKSNIDFIIEKNPTKENLCSVVKSTFSEESIYVTIMETHNINLGSTENVIVESIEYEAYWMTLDRFQVTFIKKDKNIVVLYKADTNFILM